MVTILVASSDTVDWPWPAMPSWHTMSPAAAYRPELTPEVALVRRRGALVGNDAGSSLSDSRARCRRDSSRPRRYLAAPHVGGGRTRRPGRDPAGPLYGPSLSSRLADRPPARARCSTRLQLWIDHQRAHQPPNNLASRFRPLALSRRARVLPQPRPAGRCLHRPWSR